MRLIYLLVTLAVFVTGGVQAASLQTMVGQMIVVGFKGDQRDQAGVRAVEADLAAGRIGGVLYLRHNITSQNSVRVMNEGFANSAQIVPLIALDQEGGAVERLTKAVGFTEIPSAARIAASLSVSQAERVYFDMASGLAGLGFNTNFGPVVDLNTNPDNPIIARYGRSFGESGDIVSAYAKSFIEGHRSAGVLTALKHFPGHGSSRADSHEGFVEITQTWHRDELGPYKTLIAQNSVDMVMMAHLYHAGISNDPSQQLPASLSIDWIEHTLRNSLNYDGVVISDDMEMGAITKNYGFKDAIILAVNAGTDILLFSNTANYRTSLAREVAEILMLEAEQSPAFLARVEQSFLRIMKLKSAL